MDKNDRPDMNLFEHTDAIAERDAALAEVCESNPNFSEHAMQMIADLPGGLLLTGEQIRFRLGEQGLKNPDHHNAWGALIMNAVRKGYIEKTGVWLNMTGKYSHGRMTPEYRVTQGGNN